MNRVFIFLILAFLAAGLVSCDKDDDPVNPNNNDDNIDNTDDDNDDDTEEPVYEQYGTPFEDIPETEDIVMYEVNLRALSDAGNIQGVINKLDHIEQLGVNVIWLMPIHPDGEVNSVNSPYSVKDYKAVGSEYGSLEDLRDLTNEAHSRGIAVLMDWVANHTAWDNEWIENESWYTQDENGNIIHPPGTNWQDVADLNYDNEEMRTAMLDAMQYWVYRANIDGFRCDYANGVPFDFWQNAWQTLDSIPNRELIYFAEGTRADHFTAGFDLNFGWHFYEAVKDVFNGQPASELFVVHNESYNNTPSGKHWVRFTTNHDESAWDATPVELFNGIDGAMAASVVSVFTGGVPLIYGSQEIGTEENVPFFSNSTINWEANPEMLAAYRQMLQFYAGSQVARTGQNTIYPHNDVACFRKSQNDETVLIITNLRNTSIQYSIPAGLENTIWTDVMTQNNIRLNGKLVLEPYEFFIFEE
ncbi:MAG: alpha-glucosidase C-terminal domain-containing protein [Bacteroidales bacterium]|nr:alpha-glucosidase C-terminal domain-containing protein [Bacteroidales bacterium]